MQHWPQALPRKANSRFSSLLAGTGGGSKSSLLASMLSGRGSIAWEEPRSRSTMIPDFTAKKTMVNGRPVPTGLGMRSTICAPSAAANLSEVNEEEGEEGDATTEQDTTVVASEQVKL